FYVRQKEAKKATQYFQQMKDEGLQPDSAIYLWMIYLYFWQRDYNEVLAMHQEMKAAGITMLPDTLTHVLRVLLALKRVDEAVAVYEESKSTKVRPTIATISYLMKALCEIPKYNDMCHRLFATMINERLVQTEEILESILKVCVR